MGKGTKWPEVVPGRTEFKAKNPQEAGGRPEGVRDMGLEVTCINNI